MEPGLRGRRLSQRVPVELLPEDASPLDIRYNVINWVHRSTRGWSYGASVTDPRTGEIIKGVVTLGSLRIRQDYMIAEGLLSPYKTGHRDAAGAAASGRSRGSASSRRTRSATRSASGTTTTTARRAGISVMDYPHPLVTLKADGTLDYSEVYDDGHRRVGQDRDPLGLPATSRRAPTRRAALDAILDEGHKKDLCYLTNQDIGAHADVNQWSNGTDAAAELDRA